MKLDFIKNSIRLLIKMKFYSLINILGLSIGFAIGILILLYVHNELTIDNFHSKKDRIYRLIEKKDKHIYTAAAFAGWMQEKYPEIDKITRYTVSDNAFVEMEDGSIIDVNSFALMDSTVFDIFDFNIITGESDPLKSPESIVLSESTAQKLFGNVNPIGKVIKFANIVDFTITGIIEDLPPNSSLSFNAIANFRSARHLWGWEYNVLTAEGNWSFANYVTLKENVDVEEFNSKIGPDIVERFGRPTEFALQPLADVYYDNEIRDDGVVHGKKSIVYLFISIAIFIILLASVNYINLSTSLGVKRKASIGISKILGARRGLLVFQLLTETLILAFISLIVGFLLAELFISQFNNIIGSRFEVNTFYKYPYNIMWIILVAFIGFLSGIYPALYLTKIEAVQILKGGIKTNKGISYFKKILIVFQFIITITLLVGSILVTKQIHYWKHMNIGVDKEHILAVDLNSAIRENLDAFESELDKIPGIEGFSSSNGTVGNVYNGLYDEIDEKPISMRHLYADENYIDLFGIEVIDGSGFSKEALADNRDKYLLNESAAKSLDAENVYDVKIWGRTCIGIVKDFNFGALQYNIQPLIITYQQGGNYINIKLQSNNIHHTLKEIEKVYNKFSPKFGMEYDFIDDFFNAQYKNEERLSKIVGYFSGFSILIACLGLFGLLAFIAEQRTKEIGIRKATGASVASIIYLFSKDFLKLVLFAGIISVPISYYMLDKWLQNFAYRTNISWWIFIAAILVTIFISALSVLYKAYRSAKANPVDALRYE